MMWKTSVETVQQEGFEWEHWTEWYLFWKLHFPWYTTIYYDGYYRTIHFGLFSLSWYWNNNYDDRRTI